MPIYEIVTPSPEHLRSIGFIIPIEISIPQPLIDYLTQRGIQIPQPVGGNALIDTGASISVVDLSVLSSLQINPIGVAQISTATGQENKNLFPARFILAKNLVIDFAAVIGADLRSLRIIALIGRDALRHFLLIYHGNAGRATLAF